MRDAGCRERQSVACPAPRILHPLIYHGIIFLRSHFTNDHHARRSHQAILRQLGKHLRRHKWPLAREKEIDQRCQQIGDKENAENQSAQTGQENHQPLVRPALHLHRHRLWLCCAYAPARTMGIRHPHNNRLSSTPNAEVRVGTIRL